MKSDFISIIIPVRNEEKNLPRLLESIKRLNYPKKKYEIIVVDGCSSDRTRSIAKAYKARVVDNVFKIRGAGCQLGVNVAKGKFLAFTDADCVVPANWLDLLKYFDSERVASVGGPNITPGDDTPFAKATGEVLWLLTRAGSRYGFKGKKVIESYHNPGCNVIYKKKALQEAGGFNLKLLTCEDEELDFRLRQKGYKLLFTPSIFVKHYRRQDCKKIFIQAYRFASGRAQAIKLHWLMARWFHFGPSLLLLTLVIALASAIFFASASPIAAAYIFSILLIFTAASFYLAIKNGPAAFYTYLGIIICWFLGWGWGFVYGLTLSSNTQNRKKK